MRSMPAPGFTLVEMVTVMIVIGILAVAALPRFFDPSVFEARGFADETRAQLRYAQKAAVAQRRTVCVAINANGVALTIASAANSAACNTALTLPNANPRGGTGLAASVSGATIAGFNFTSAGGTDQTANISIVILGSATAITIDPVTGYVY